MNNLWKRRSSRTWIKYTLGESCILELHLLQYMVSSCVEMSSTDYSLVCLISPLITVYTYMHDPC